MRDSAQQIGDEFSIGCYLLKETVVQERNTTICLHNRLIYDLSLHMCFHAAWESRSEWCLTESFLNFQGAVEFCLHLFTGIA